MKAFYFRFSARDTALDKLGFDRCWQSALDWGCDEDDIYWDFDSGANPNRENYQRLIEAIADGRYEEIATPNQTRIHRDSVESQLFGRLLRKKKVKLHLLESRGELNLETSEARRQYSLDGLFAEWEYEKIQERNVRNWRDIRRKGISVFTPFGYVINSDRKPEIDLTPTVCLLETKEILSYADILQEIIKLTFEIGSLKQVVKAIHKKYGVYRFNPENLNGDKPGRKRHIRSKKLNPHTNNPHIHRKPLFFSQSGLGHLLRNEILIGSLVYLKGTPEEITIVDNHPPLMSKGDFKRLGRIISNKANPISAKGTKAKYPLTGLVYCGLCGGTCYSAKCGNKGRKREYYYFRCKNINSNCISKPIRFEVLETALNARLVERYKEITKLAIKPESPKVNPKIAALEKQLIGLISLPFVDENIKASIKKTQAEIDHLNSNSETEHQVSQEQIKLLESAFQNPLYWETLTQPEKREIYHALTNRIVISVDIQEKNHPDFELRKSYVGRIDLLV